MAHFLKHYPYSTVCTVLICYLCLKTISLSGLGALNFPGADKLVHWAMYFGLCLLVWGERHLNGRQSTLRSAALYTIWLPLLLGGAIEIAQEYLTTDRSGDWADFAADALGVLTALPLGLYALPRILKRTKKTSAKQ